MYQVAYHVRVQGSILDVVPLLGRGAGNKFWMRTHVLGSLGSRIRG